MFQSLNRAYKRSDAMIVFQGNSVKRFQSLNRAYKRSDTVVEQGLFGACAVSIPQSGLQAFRLSFLVATMSEL